MKVDLDYFDLTCSCGHVMAAKVKNDAWLSKCGNCDTLLVVQPVTRKKPNKFLVEFVVTGVPVEAGAA